MVQDDVLLLIHLPLDVELVAFYSLPIFGTRLATLAIPVAGPKKALGVARRFYSPATLVPYSVSNSGVVDNLALPDGGQLPN